MIHVEVKKNDEFVARVEIRNLEVHPDQTADYQVRFLVSRGSAVGLHRRTIWRFPRKDLNALALLRLALETLDEKELALEHQFDPDKDEASVSSDVARGFSGTMRSIQGRLGRLYRD